MIKRILKRLLAFLLVLTISTCTLVHKEEKKVQAVAGIDDLAIVGLIVTGTCLVLGTYGYLSKNNSKGAVESFKDAFGADTYKYLLDYISAIDINKATVAINSVEIKSSALASAAKKVKAQYKFPVEQTASGYKTYNLNGEVVEAATLQDFINQNIFTGRQYYMVESLADCPYTVNTSGEAVLKQDVYNDIAKAVKALTKKIVNVGKGILDWFMDKTAATAVDTIGTADPDYFYIHGTSYGDAFSSEFSDITAITVNHYAFTASFNGIMFELRVDDNNIWYGVLTAENFESAVETYRKYGDLSVFSNYMCLNQYDFNDWGPGGVGLARLNGGTIKAACQMSGGMMGLVNVNGVTCIDGSRKSYDIAELPAPITEAHIINNGLTGNYVIGTLQEDKSITFDVVGESSSYPYVDGLTKGDHSVKVSGDVTLNDKILSQVMDNNLTVEEINSQIADVSDSVIAIDDSIKNGFESNNNWLSRIWELLMGFPAMIFSPFSSIFDRLFGYLADMLSGILDIPDDIVSSISDLKDVVLDIPALGNIIDVLTDVKNGIVAIPDAFTDAISAIGDIVLELPSDVVGIFSDILDGIKAIPSEITSLLEDMFTRLVVPSSVFFDGWKNKFSKKLQDKLPYVTYNDMLENFKEIKSAKLEDITITMYGQTSTIFSFKWYYKYENDINNLIRGFMFFFLVFYNLNMIYKLIRGSSLFEIQKIGKNAGKTGEFVKSKK